jgi:hypothetical protein
VVFNLWQLRAIWGIANSLVELPYPAIGSSAFVGWLFFEQYV